MNFTAENNLFAIAFFLAFFVPSLLFMKNVYGTFKATVYFNLNRKFGEYSLTHKMAIIMSVLVFIFAFFTCIGTLMIMYKMLSN